MTASFNLTLCQEARIGRKLYSCSASRLSEGSIKVAALMMARHGTKRARHGVLTCVSKAILHEIAMSDGGNIQILARAPLDTPKFCK